MQHFITLEQASDNAHKASSYDDYQSVDFMIASVIDEFVERGYDQWLIREINHEDRETDIELTIVDPVTNEERYIGMHYYPEGVVSDEDEDQCYYFWDDSDDPYDSSDNPYEE